MAPFSFPILADDERSRSLLGQDPRFVEADHVRDETDCVIRIDRTFMRPLLPAGTGLSEG